jgi:hypothetical protein
LFWSSQMMNKTLGLIAALIAQRGAAAPINRKLNTPAHGAGCGHHADDTSHARHSYHGRRTIVIIDSHQHVFWHWRNDADLIADMDRHGIDVAWLLTWEITPAEEDPNWVRILNPGHVAPTDRTRACRCPTFCLPHRAHRADSSSVTARTRGRETRRRCFESAYHIHRVRVCGEWKFRMAFEDPRCIALFQKGGRAEMPGRAAPGRADAGGQAAADVVRRTVDNLERALQTMPRDDLHRSRAGVLALHQRRRRDEPPTPTPAGPVTPGGRVIELLDKYPNLYADLFRRLGSERAAARPSSHAAEFVTASPTG